MFLFVFVLPCIGVFVTILAGYVYRLAGARCHSTNRLDGKTVIITGGTSGIGKSTAKDLASRGARIILACRNLTKGEDTIDWIRTTTGSDKVFAKKLDLSDLDSVRGFAKDTIATENRLDILINNAGVCQHSKKESAQGYELTYATNHLGHFLLTNLLLDKLKENGHGRIVNLSSEAHKLSHLDCEDIHFKERSYNMWKAYAQSKLCNILFTKELAQRLRNTGVTCNCLHPGIVSTDIFNRENTIFGALSEYSIRVFGKTSEQGAQTSIYLAIADEVADVSGEYFVDCKIARTSGKAKKQSLASKLWEISEIEAHLTQ